MTELAPNKAIVPVVNAMIGSAYPVPAAVTTVLNLRSSELAKRYPGWLRIIEQGYGQQWLDDCAHYATLGWHFSNVTPILQLLPGNLLRLGAPVIRIEQVLLIVDRLMILWDQSERFDGLWTTVSEAFKGGAVAPVDQEVLAEYDLPQEPRPIGSNWLERLGRSIAQTFGNGSTVVGAGYSTYDEAWHLAMRVYHFQMAFDLTHFQTQRDLYGVIWHVRRLFCTDLGQRLAEGMFERFIFGAQKIGLNLQLIDPFNRGIGTTFAALRTWVMTHIPNPILKQIGFSTEGDRKGDNKI